MTTHILLIDDHALFRSGLQMVLTSSVPDIHTDQVASIEEAMAGALKTPDIVLLDVQLQGLSGLAGIALVKRRWPGTLVVMLSSIVERHTVSQALKSGAAAFVSKADKADSIVSVITALMRGDRVAHRLSGAADNYPADLTGSTAPVRPTPDQTPDQRLHLTPRQLEVLDLMCQGLSNKLIGRKLNMSENTVRGHVQATLAFLGVSSRTEAAFVARRNGLVQ